MTKLGMILLSSFLIFATAPAAPAQSTDSAQDQTTKKQAAAHKGTASKDDIKSAQQALKDKGLYTGTVDGSMNADTQNALRDFQKQNNLKVTGTLNHETMAALGITEHQQVATGSQNKPAATTTSPKSGTLGHKKSGPRQTSSLSKDKIRQTQEELKNQGFDPGPVDGIMGPMTMTAIRNYQLYNHLQATGTLTAETDSALKGSATASTGRSKPGPNEGSAGVSSSPEDIRHAQLILDELMYMPGEVNGIMTQQTRDAIRRFQFLNNLPVTGNLDKQTRMALDEQWCGSCVSSQLPQPSSSNAQLQKPSTALETQAQHQTGSAVQSPGTSAQKSDRSYDTTADPTRRAVKAKKVDKDITDRVAKASEVLRDLTGGADKRIPNSLLGQAEAIAVIPHVIKGAFGVGGRYGKGLVSERLNDGRWSAPAFMSIGGGSFGAQIGVSSTDLVLVFTDKNALNLLEGGKDLKLGADASVAAGPIGRSAEAGVNLNLETGIYAYSRSKGLFAGIALDGAVLSMDKDTNEEVYGTSNAKDILGGAVAVNNTVRPFVNALHSIAPKRISQK